MTDFPLVLDSAGAKPTAPVDILAALLASVAKSNPGYTANLPGSLIEDISSTDVGAVALIDAARVELINSLTPFGANAFLLNQLGQVYGVPLGKQTNTSVFVVFSGTPGFVVAKGFVVSDGTFQYIVQDGGIIGAGGTSAPLFAIASQTGSWSVAAGTVTELITSVPSTVTLTVDNPTAGTPGAGAETEQSYRAAVLQAGLAVSQGMATYLRTLLGNVSGVQRRLIGIKQVANNGGWTIICGGGDPYEIAYAIYTALFDISSLVGSTLSVTNITNANPGVVTTDLNHGYTTGQTVEITGVVGMPAVNGTAFTATVISEKTFSIGVDTSGYGTYESGGVVTPNLRNVSVSINDYPDNYIVPFVNPPQQTVTMAVTWNTIEENFVSQAAVAQLAGPAIVDYINSIPAGDPINVFVLDSVFQDAVASVLPIELLTRLVFTVSINGVGTSPTSGTGIIAGDPESFFEASVDGIVISQG